MSTQSHDFSGFYMSVGLGRTAIEDSSTEYFTADDSSNGYTNLNKDTSNAITISLGYDWVIGDLVLGLEGRIQRRSLDDYGFQTENGVVNSDYATGYRSDLSKQILVRMGHLIGQADMVYVNAGLVRTDYTRIYTDFIEGNEDALNGTDSGRILGFGFEHFVSENYSVRTEINHIWYEKTTHEPPTAWPGEYDIHDATETGIAILLVRHF